MEALEKIISDRIDAFLLKLAAETHVDGQVSGTKPSPEDFVRKLDQPKFLDLFERILDECEAASRMPRPEFRELFFRLVRQRLDVTPNHQQFRSAVKRERRRRGRDIHNRPKPLTSCPICLGVPDKVSDPLVEFQPQPCNSPECDGTHYCYLNSYCHPNSGLITEYCEKHGILTLMCNKCEAPLMAFQLLPVRIRQTAIIQ